MIEVALAILVIGTLTATAAVGYPLVQERAARGSMTGDLQTYVETEQAYFQAVGSYAGAAALLSTQRFATTKDVIVDSVAMSAEHHRVYMRVRHTKSNERCSVDFSSRSRNAINRIQCFDSVAEEEIGAPDSGSGATLGTINLPPKPSETDSVVVDPNAPVSPLVIAGADLMGMPGDSFTRIFEVRNRSSETRWFIPDALSSNPSVVGQPRSMLPIEIAGGGSVSVPIDYTVAAEATEGAVSVLSLRAADGEVPNLVGEDDLTFATALKLLAPTVAGTVPTIVDSGVPFFAQFDIQHPSNGPRMLGIVGRSSGPAPSLQLIGSSGTGDLPYAPFSSGTARLQYLLDPNVEGGSWYTISLDVADKARPEFSASKELSVQARLVLRNPLVPSFADRTEYPGTGYVPADGSDFRVEWTFINRSNAQRTFLVEPLLGAGSDLIISSGSAPWTVTVPKRTQQAIPIDYRVRGGSVVPTTSSAMLRVTDASAPTCAAQNGVECSATASINVITGLVPQNPRLETVPVDTATIQGQQFTRTWVVRNATNTAAVLNIVPSVDAGSALRITGASNTGPVGFAAFEQKTVTVDYEVGTGAAAVPETTHEIGLVTTDRDRTSYQSPDSWLFTVVNRAPTAAFSLSYSNRIMAQVGEPVTFDPRSSSDPDSDGLDCRMGFGDGTGDWTGDCTATLAHSFTAGGTYTIELAVDDGHVNDSGHSTVKTIEVNTQPVAGYSYTPSSPYGPQVGSAASFVSTSMDVDSDPLICSWSFGDGSSASGCSVSKTFAAGGATYPVVMTVDDSRGGVRTESKSIYVNTPPVANQWSYTPMFYPQAGSPISFSGNASDVDGDALSCSWAFGDGTSLSGCSPNKAYGSGGNKGVTLTVHDGMGPAVSYSRTVYVNSNPIPSFDQVPAIPQVGSAASFRSTSSDPEGNAISCSWSGEVVGTGCVVSRTFSSGGNKSITLSLSDGYGGSAAVTKSVYVNTAPAASFAFSPGRPNEGQNATFTSTSSDPDGNPLSCSWSFSDGTTASGCSVGKVFNSGGSRSATLTVSDGFGGSNSSSQGFAVNRRPNAAVNGPTTVYTGDSACYSLSGSDPDGDGLSYSPGTSWCTSWGSAGGQTVSGTVSDGSLSTTASRGVTVISKVYGCTDPGAGNYNGSATHDNGSCSYNQGPSISVNCQTGISVGAGYLCSASVSDPNGDAVSVRWDDGQTGTTASYTAASASTYTHCANADDGRGGTARACGQTSADPIPGCTDPGASNYEGAATVDNGTCTYNDWSDTGNETVTYTLGDHTCYNGSPKIRGPSANIDRTVSVSGSGGRSASISGACSASGTGSASCTIRTTSLYPGERAYYNWTATYGGNSRSRTLTAQGCIIQYEDATNGNRWNTCTGDFTIPVLKCDGYP